MLPLEDPWYETQPDRYESPAPEPASDNLPDTVRQLREEIDAQMAIIKQQESRLNRLELILLKQTVEV
jgi:hypothetical protein